MAGGLDDWSALVPQQPGQPDAFRQGTLLAFNPVTGANSVDVSGAVLIDVPLLNIGDTVNLAPNQVVVLMKLKSSWAILGRVIAPNRPGSEQLAVASSATETKNATGTNFAVTTTDVAVATTPQFTVPIWANKAEVMVVGVANARNSTGNAGFLYGFARVAFQSGDQQSNEVHVSAQANLAPFANQPFLAATHVGSISGAIGGQTFTASMVVSTDATTGNWAASTSNQSKVSAIAIYTRTP